jgi:hypothetical protein
MSDGAARLGGVESELPYPLRNFARYQSGVVSRPQALRAGFSAGMIKFRVASGRWRQLNPGVYATFTGPPGRPARLWAAVLSSGPSAVLSHETAAELHQLIDRPTAIIHVTVPGQRRVRPVEGVSIHRSMRAVQATLGHSCPPRTKIEETILDLTQTARTIDDVCGWVTRAFARDLTDETRLREAMTARPKLRWRADLHEFIVAAAEGDHSVLEFRYHRDVEQAHRLPKPSQQVPFTGPGRRRGRRDRLYEDYGVAVELDGRLAHPEESRGRDRARDNAAAVDGIQSLRYDWEQVKWHACETALEVAQVLRQRGWTGRPRPCSPVCPVWVAFPPDSSQAVPVKTTR